MVQFVLCNPQSIDPDEGTFNILKKIDTQEVLTQVRREVGEKDFCPSVGLSVLFRMMLQRCLLSVSLVCLLSVYRLCLLSVCCCRWK